MWDRQGEGLWLRPADHDTSMTIVGAEKPELQELPQIGERMSFIYLEYCKIGRTDSAITSTDKRGTVSIPSASIGALLLGPGTTISHRAIELLGDSGASVVWVGEKGVRYYAHGRSLTHSSLLLDAQARAVSNTRSRLAVARKMYAMRFPGEDVSHLTMQQLRGREGSRIRSVYRKWSQSTGVEWNGRQYDSSDYSSSDPVNQALSAANACLYGAVHSVIVSMGCSPGLGFVHTGHERSFVYDIADLYKTEVTIPVAFQIASKPHENIGAATRKAVRDSMYSQHIMERCARDIKDLLLGKAEMEESGDDLSLWDDRGGSVPSGTQYGGDDE